MSSKQPSSPATPPGLFNIPSQSSPVGFNNGVPYGYPPATTGHTQMLSNMAIRFPDLPLLYHPPGDTSHLVPTDTGGAYGWGPRPGTRPKTRDNVAGGNGPIPQPDATVSYSGAVRVVTSQLQFSTLGNDKCE